MKRQPIRRRLLASCLAVLVLGASAVPPLLDAGEDERGARVEREHDPGSCGVLHNHTACSQLAKSFGRAAPAASVVLGPGVSIGSGAIRDAVVPPLRTDAPRPSPRAPPILLG